MDAETNDRQLWHVETICRKLPFTKPDPIDPGNYCDELTGDWKDVPAWAIRRINFLEDTSAFNERSRCPRGHDTCPDVGPDPDSPEGYSCTCVKHCYPYLCKGGCGHNEIWVSDAEKELIQKYRREKYG